MTGHAKPLPPANQFDQFDRPDFSAFGTPVRDAVDLSRFGTPVPDNVIQADPYILAAAFAAVFVAGVVSALAINWLWARRARHRPPAPATPKPETRPPAWVSTVPAMTDAEKNRAVLWAMVALAVAMASFPPWRIVDADGAVLEQLGYAFIADPPYGDMPVGTSSLGTRRRIVASIDLTRLAIQVTAVAAFAFAWIKLRR